MKRLIIPIVIALLAGIGGGSGYAYMNTSPAVHADSAAHDSTSHGSTIAEKTRDDASGATTDAAIVDSMHSADSMSAADTSHPAPTALTTPSDSIRAMQAARATFRSEVKGYAPPAPAAARGPMATPTNGTMTSSAVAKGTDAPSTSEVAEVVRAARNDALSTALPEQRLAKIFAAMQAKDAAKVLEQMTDSDIRAILGLMSDRQAAAIIATLPAQRAANITRGGTRAPGSNP